MQLMPNVNLESTLNHKQSLKMNSVISNFDSLTIVTTYTSYI